MPQETFYRPPEVGRETRRLPAPTYNLAYILLRRCGSDSLFVPIRSMQYLAILDAEEFIFVDREGRRIIELSWQGFRPQARHNLTDPVAYEVVYYAGTAPLTMRRLQGEFYLALRELEAKLKNPGQARVIRLGEGNG